MLVLTMHETIQVLVIGDAVPTGLDGVTSGGPSLLISGPVPVPASPYVVSRRAVDVVLVGARAPRPVEIVRETRAVVPSVRVLVEAATPSPALAADVLAAGGSGVIPAGLQSAALGDALVRAHHGELVLDEEDLRSLVRSLTSARASAASPALTHRELEVLSALAEGRDTPEIAAFLEVSPATVKAHVKSVLMKLRAHSKIEAVRIAWREGLVAVPV
jgi:DNA-binding NarL/FixJ family response regulator